LGTNRLWLGLRGSHFDGLNQLGEGGEMTFHLGDGVGIREPGKRGGVAYQGGAMGRLTEAEKLVSECPGRVHGQTVAQRGPLGCLLAAQLNSQFTPLRGFVR
jgi:hypothetical protein